MTMDINFFEPYLLERVETSGSNNLMLGAGCVAVALIAGSLGYNTFTLSATNKAIAGVEGELNNVAFKEKYVEATAVSKEKEILTTYDSTLRDIFGSMKDRAVVKNELIAPVYSTVPSGVLFKDVSVEGGAITIVGESDSENAIAELQYNLNNLPFISSSHVPKIVSDLEAKETFAFSIVCALKEEYYENK